jgi:hypothetical protein
LITVKKEYDRKDVNFINKKSMNNIFTDKAMKNEINYFYQLLIYCWRKISFQLAMLLFMPRLIGFDLFALSTIFKTPPIKDTGYFVSGLAFRNWNKKYPKGTFKNTKHIVKNTINRRYPTCPDELFPTVGGFQVWLAYIKSQTTSNI